MFQTFYLSVFLFLMACTFQEAFADSFYPVTGVDLTDEAYVVPLHQNQFFIENEYDQSGINNVSSNALTILDKYGLSPNSDFAIQLPYSLLIDKRSSKNSGFNDITYGLKFRFTGEQQNHLLFSTVFAMKPPNANPSLGLGNGTSDFSSHIDLTYRRREFQHAAVLGYNFLGTMPNTTRRNHIFYRYKFSYYPTGSQWMFATEAFREPNQFPNNPSPFTTLTKTSWQPNNKIIFDLGIRFGYNSSVPSRSYFFGITLIQ